MPRRHTPGYSLIEFAVSLAIAGIVAAAAIGVFTNVNNSVLRLRTKTAVDAKLQRITNALVADLQEIGGGAVRPWHALLVQPGDKERSDGALLLTADADSPPCTVRRRNESRITLAREGGEPCCLDVAARDADLPQPFAGRVAILTLNDQATVVTLGDVNTGACRVEGRTLLDLANGDCDDDIDDDRCWSNATLTVVNAKWLVVDTKSSELKAWQLYASGAGLGVDPTTLCDGCAPPLRRGYEADERLLAADVYDLQFALGYDVNADGVVFESVTGGGDEWIGNAANEVDGVGTWLADVDEERGPDGATFARIDLRAVQFGVTVGLPTRAGDHAAVTVFDGAAQGGGRLRTRASLARASLRSAAVFQ